MRLATAAALLCFLFLAMPASAGLIVNGGFETGNLYGWTLSGDLTPAYHGVSNVGAHSGTYTAWFGTYGTIYLSQSVPTVPGQLYAAGFWVGNYAGDPPAQNSFQVSWNGTEVATAPANMPSVPWTSLQGTFTATSTTTTIEFAFSNGPGWWNLDDVDISPVPEPGTLSFAALACAVLLVGFRVRRLAPAYARRR